MSDRERWIVYPLLGFALMLGFRGASLSTLKCRDVECQSLRVQTINGTAYVPGTTTVIVTPSGTPVQLPSGTPPAASTAPVPAPAPPGTPSAEQPQADPAAAASEAAPQ